MPVQIICSLESGKYSPDHNKNLFPISSSVFLLTVQHRELMRKKRETGSGQEAENTKSL